MKDWSGYYYVSFGPGDSSDYLDLDIEISDADYQVLMESLKNPKNGYEKILNKIEDEQYEEVEKIEIENALDMHDEYVEKCVQKGKSPFDEGYTLTIKILEPADISLDYIDKGYLKYREDSDEYDG